LFTSEIECFRTLIRYDRAIIERLFVVQRAADLVDLPPWAILTGLESLFVPPPSPIVLQEDKRLGSLRGNLLPPFAVDETVPNTNIQLQGTFSIYNQHELG
jgi:hypothetical protein